MKLYWGDIHNHCGITYGYGSLENALKAAQTQLDFCSVTPHAMWPDMPPECPETAYLLDYHRKGFARIAQNWEQVKNVVESANQDGRFVTLHSYEMHHCGWGDYHFVSPSPAMELIERSTPAETARAQEVPVIAVPHHIGYPPGYRGISWDLFQEELSPVVEVYSKHGCAVSDISPYPYYHAMGPRDGRNTAWEGLRQGKIFSFAASTDHHAGFPGSYGDGRIAVLARSLTRQDIWEALKAGRTYAVTGDKIQCSFTVNGSPFGSRIQAGRRREIRWEIELEDFLDKAVVYKNLVPIKVICGEELPWLPREKTQAYKIRTELGWGGPESEGCRWECTVKAEGGRLAQATPYFRGRSILSPREGRQYGENVNALHSRIQSVTSQEAVFEMETNPNDTTLHPSTSSVLLTVEGDPHTRLLFRINGKSVAVTVGELLEHSVAGEMKPWASHGYRIHRAVPACQYRFAGVYEEESGGEYDFYHMEILQKNGQAAWISPVFVTGA